MKKLFQYHTVISISIIITHDDWLTSTIELNLLNNIFPGVSFALVYVIAQGILIHCLYPMCVRRRDLEHY